MRNRLIILAVGIFSLALSVDLSGFTRKRTTQQDIESMDLLSQTKGISRQTELSAPDLSIKAPKGDTDIVKTLIDRDPNLKIKWDIKMTDTLTAWRRHGEYGNDTIKVCVIDTGIDTSHPMIQSKLDINPGESCPGKDGQRQLCEKSKNGVDDDGNGFVDDVYGYDFALDRGTLSDTHGHGTHIAGIIAGHGGYGIAPGVKLIIAKYYDPKAPGNNNLLNTVRAIRYCTQRQADIINYSGGGLDPSPIELKAIEEAKNSKGQAILFIAAAGNERSNSDLKKYYPAAYELPSIISVTAIDAENNVLSSSNFGETTVDIAAPGKNIYSLIPGGKFGHMTGTSQGTAVVTGAAALIKAKFPDYSATEVIGALTESGDFRPDKLVGKTNRQKTLNIYRALAIIGAGTSVSGIKPNNVMNLRPEQFSVNSAESNPSNALGVSAETLNTLLKSAEKDLGKKKNRRLTDN